MIIAKNVCNFFINFPIYRTFISDNNLYKDKTEDFAAKTYGKPSVNLSRIVNLGCTH